MSWVHEDGGYQLFCNRDEKLTRLTASAPRIEQRGGVRIVAPTDADRGGTWIAANEFGVSVCLLNGARSAAGLGPESVSRGHLVRRLSGVRSSAEGAGLIAAMDLKPFAAFTLVLLEPGQPACVLEWNGVRLAIRPDAEDAMPLTSSSFEAASVWAARQQAFENKRTGGPLNATLLSSFHASHDPAAGAFSTCMHRPDAETVSFSRVSVTRAKVRFFYTPAAPCRQAPGKQISIARRAA